MFIREHAVIGDILNLEVASVNHEKAKIILKVPAYYLSFSPFYYQTQQHCYFEQQALPAEGYYYPGPQEGAHCSYYGKITPTFSTSTADEEYQNFGSAGKSVGVFGRVAGRNRTYSAPEHVSWRSF